MSQVNVLLRHTDYLQAAHAATHQVIGKISSPSEVIGNGAQYDARSHPHCSGSLVVVGGFWQLDTR